MARIYGANGRKPSVEVFGESFYRLPEMVERLGSYPREDNSKIAAFLDKLLADGCSLARDFHDRRRK